MHSTHGWPVYDGYMKYALFGWGVVIYALLSLYWSMCITYGLTEGLLPQLLQLVLLVVLLVLAGVTTRKSSWKDVLPYSVVWTLSVALLDGLLSFPFSGISIYTNPFVLAGYALVLIVPLFAAQYCVFCGMLGLTCPLHQNSSSAHA